MTDRDHERAIDLITRGVEDVSAPDAAWLESHLALCTECTGYAEACQSTGELLRAVAVTASPALVAATQARLRAHALFMEERRSRIVLIAVSFCIGALSSTLSAWLWLKFGGWAAARLGWSPAIVEPGIFVAWLVPAVIVAVAMLASSHPVIDRSVTLAWLGEERQGGRP
ncbi:MAG: hypothetical protein WCC87_17330 [Candidatus Korobacteraceae bacterium]